MSAPHGPFEEYFFNGYMRGSLTRAFLRACVHTFGTIFYFGVLSLLSAGLAIGLGLQLLSGGPAGSTDPSPLGKVLILAFLGIAGFGGLALSFGVIRGAWRVYGLVARTKRALDGGEALAYVEGLPRFWGGRQSMGRTGGKAPDKLDVCGRTFDLQCCLRPPELSKLQTESFTSPDALPRGTGSGFILDVPLRVWFVPSTGVLVRVDVARPFPA